MASWIDGRDDLPEAPDSPDAPDGATGRRSKGRTETSWMVTVATSSRPAMARNGARGSRA